MSGVGGLTRGRRVRGDLSSALGVTRCGRSAGCVPWALWAISAAVLEGGGGGAGGGRNIIFRMIRKRNGWGGGKGGGVQI